MRCFLQDARETDARPVGIVDEDHQGPVRGGRLQDASQSPRRLLGNGQAAREPKGGQQPRGHPARLLTLAEEAVDLGPHLLRRILLVHPGGLLDDVGERPHGPALGRGSAPNPDHPGRDRFLEAAQERLGHHGLAHAGSAGDPHDGGDPLRKDALKRLPQALELSLSSHERRLPQGGDGGIRQDLQEAKWADRLVAVHPGSTVNGLNGSGVSDPPVHPLAHDDLPGLGHALEPHCQVDDTLLPQSRCLGSGPHHLRHPDAGPHDGPRAGTEVARRRRDDLADLGRRPDGPKRAVGGSRLRPEHGNQRVGAPSEGVHRAAVALQHTADLLQRVRHLLQRAGCIPHLRGPLAGVFDRRPG